jgi:predicted RNase H-like HicB family nuclease
VATRTYLAIVDQAPGEEGWSITFPAFPGVTSDAFDIREIVPQARDALATIVEYMVSESEVLPPALEDGALPDFDPSEFDAPRALLVPVEVPGRAVRVNISLDEGLLGRLDEIARRSGSTRSGLLARGAKLVIAEETAG